MSVWELVKIRDLGNIVTGKTPKTSVSAYYEGGQTPFITPGDLEWRTFRVCQTESRVTQMAMADYASSTIKEGAVCVVCIGNTIGKCGIASEDSISNQQINSIEVSEEHDARFVYYALIANHEKVRIVASGSATPIVNKGTFSRLQIRVPCLSEQQKIASVLSAYDELIENNLKRIKLLEEKARQTYLDRFVRNPQNSKASFRSVYLAELCSTLSRGPSLTYSDDADAKPVLNQRCVRGGEIELDAVRLAQPLTKKKSHLYVQYADTLINSMGDGTLGRVSRNLSLPNTYIVHNCITIVRAREEELKFYLFYYLSNREDLFVQLAQGSTGQTSLKLKLLKTLRVTLPTAEDLQDFAGFCQPIWRTISHLKKENIALREARDILLPRLMTGIIDVEELDVEIPLNA